MPSKKRKSSKATKLPARRVCALREVGSDTDYGTELVFEGYVNRRTDVIFLAGVPDVPESRPHSRVNRR